jgi:hypothetical protein
MLNQHVTQEFRMISLLISLCLFSSFLVSSALAGLNLPAVKGRLTNDTNLETDSLVLKLSYARIRQGEAGSDPGEVLRELTLVMSADGSFVVPAQQLPDSDLILMLKIADHRGNLLPLKGLASNLAFGLSLRLNRRDQSYERFLSNLKLESWTHEQALRIKTTNGEGLKQYVESYLQRLGAQFLDSQNFRWQLNLSASLSHERYTDDPRRNSRALVSTVHVRTDGSNGIPECSRYDQCLASSDSNINQDANELLIRVAAGEAAGDTFVFYPPKYFHHPGLYRLNYSLELRVFKRGQIPIHRSFILMRDRRESSRRSDILKDLKLELPLID